MHTPPLQRSQPKRKEKKGGGGDGGGGDGGGVEASCSYYMYGLNTQYFSH